MVTENPYWTHVHPRRKERATDQHRWTQIRRRHPVFLSVFIRVHLWLKNLRPAVDRAQSLAGPFDFATYSSAFEVLLSESSSGPASGESLDTAGFSVAVVPST